MKRVVFSWCLPFTKWKCFIEKKILRILEISRVYPLEIYFLTSANVYVVTVQAFQYLRKMNIKNIKNNS